MTQDKTGDDGLKVIATRLMILFERRTPKGRPYTVAEVAEGTGISETTLKQLRRGINSNPTINTLTAIAKFFDVPPTYWVSDEDPEEQFARRDLRTAMTDAGIESIALRSQGLNAENIRFVTEAITMARKSQGLDPI
ncbi:helix-turn-helix domain-containing protein [Streptacidiphilus sp. MAP5-52]|uniref:helix-turn-helix domain-containing protein n=1 Tax=Streptacidiphilus sp. MAP5-52 TaxID=3156267 RepID=UPI0035196437